jgi:hypothetical protein
MPTLLATSLQATCETFFCVHDEAIFKKKKNTYSAPIFQCPLISLPTNENMADIETLPMHIFYIISLPTNETWPI